MSGNILMNDSLDREQPEPEGGIPTLFIVRISQAAQRKELSEHKFSNS